MNSNLPPGTLPRDVSDPDECSKCEGFGQIEEVMIDDGERVVTKKAICPDCSGLGVVNKRVKR